VREKVEDVGAATWIRLDAFHVAAFTQKPFLQRHAYKGPHAYVHARVHMPTQAFIHGATFIQAIHTRGHVPTMAGAAADPAAAFAAGALGGVRNAEGRAAADAVRHRRGDHLDFAPPAPCHRAHACRHCPGPAVPLSRPRPRTARRQVVTFKYHALPACGCSTAQERAGAVAVAIARIRAGACLQRPARPAVRICRLHLSACDAPLASDARLDASQMSYTDSQRVLQRHGKEPDTGWCLSLVLVFGACLWCLSRISAAPACTRGGLPSVRTRASTPESTCVGGTGLGVLPHARAGMCAGANLTGLELNLIMGDIKANRANAEKCLEALTGICLLPYIMYASSVTVFCL